MPTPRASLKSFLSTAKKALLAPPAQRPNPLTFVVGNESADLDSICSALLLAYFRTHTPSHNTLHIPLSNLPRADLALRPELAAVLSPAGLTPSDLITLSDLPKPLSAGETRWLLVDHNVPTGVLASSFLSEAEGAGKLLGCIDHHEDEGVVPEVGALGEGAVRVFARCGSCMSLVLDQCKEVWQRLAADAGDQRCEDGVSGEECDDQIARIALAAVLVDTNNLASKDKTTNWDVRAVEMAEERVIGEKGYDRRAYHDQLTELKEQILGMSYRDVLRKDYKRWTEGKLAVGMSTVVRGLEYLLKEVGDKSREGFMETLRDWAREQQLDVAAVMTVSRPNGVFTRELLVWGLNEDAVKAMGQFVRKSGETLKLETWNEGMLDAGDETSSEWRMCWWQKGVEHSRKQVAPMLREAMKESSRL
ncbi:hypothetical protein VTI74DRAFT_3557 [Chaetomium olivicolor]